MKGSAEPIHLMKTHSYVGQFAAMCVACFATIGMTVSHAAFPLPMPTRPTNFRLAAPTNTQPVTAWGVDTNGQIDVPASLSSVVAVAAGGDHNLALKADGTVVAWGRNNWGQTVVPAGLTNVVRLAAGNFHSLALTSGGRVVSWGYNVNTPPSYLSNVVAIAVDAYLGNLALRSDGTVVTWGFFALPSQYPPTGLSNVVAISAGNSHSLALKEDGTVVGWGDNSYGQPAGLSNVVSIAAGYQHSIALRADSTVVGWGLNENYQAVPPVGLSNVIAIAAGYFHNLALTSDGVVVGWGRNDYGQARAPSGFREIVGITAGRYHSVALGGAAPVILDPPVSQVVLQNSNLTFSVAATGTKPVFYQWRKDGIDIPGANGSTFVVSNVVFSYTGLRFPGDHEASFALTNAQFGDAGNYSVVLSNEVGFVCSSNATLVVLPFGAPIARADGAVIVETVTRNLSSVLTLASDFPNAHIFYTLDGTAPTFSSRLYGSPVTVSNTVVVRAVAFNSDFSESFESPTVTLAVLPYTISLTNGGGGFASVSPAHSYYGSNSTVTLTATPDAGWTFLGWEGDVTSNSNPLVISMNRSVQLEAVFGTLVATNVVGNGRIEAVPSGLVRYGTIVQLLAVPGAGQQFVTWGGSVSGTNNPRFFQVTQGNPAVSALFTALPLRIIEGPSDQTVAAGSTVTLQVTAQGTPPLNYQWRKEGLPMSGANDIHLVFTNTTTSETGLYDVIVRGSQGSVTSAVANVAVGYSLAMQVIGAGSIAAFPSQAIYLPGETVVLNATANAESEFWGWTTPLVTTRTPLSLTLTSNSTVTAVFTNRVLSAARGNYAGLFVGTDGWRRTNSGLVAATLTPLGRLRGAVRMEQRLYRFAGVIPSAGERVSEIHFAGPAESQFTWTCELTPNGLRGRLISTAGWEADVEADVTLRKWQPGKLPAEFVSPEGTASVTGMVTFTRSGRVVWKGRVLPEAALFRFTGPITRDGRCPVYQGIRLRGTSETRVLAGWLELETSGVAGELYYFDSSHAWMLVRRTDSGDGLR
jgi:hypothetical protein